MSPLARTCAAVIAGLVSLVVAGPAQGAFPGANGSIAAAISEPHPNRVDIIDPATGRGEQLTGGALPSWSPDGTKLAIRIGLTGWEIHVLDLALRESPSGGCPVTGFRTYPSEPDWAPDGRLSFSCQTAAGGRNVYVANGGPGKLVREDACCAAWSPDGSHIAFLDWSDETLWVMNADGGGARRLLDVPHDGYSWRPDWSPDSQRIAFHMDVSPPDGCCGVGNFEAFTIKRDGTGLRRLTFDSAGDTQPTFSPDGKLIAFVRARGQEDEVYLMNANGTGQGRLTTTPPEEAEYRGYGGLDWQADPCRAGAWRRSGFKSEQACLTAVFRARSCRRHAPFQRESSLCSPGLRPRPI